jgi:hypothetical protein
MFESRPVRGSRKPLVDGPQSAGEVTMSRNDTEYFRQRASVERALSITSSDPAVAAVHTELAERYEALVSDANRPPLRLVVGRAA